MIDRNVELNQVVLAALRQVESLAPLIGLGSGVLARARGLSQYFDDARTQAVIFAARSQWAARAEHLGLNEDSLERRDLASLAAVILSHQSFEFAAAASARAPRAWFVNLESLFERAVRNGIRLVRPQLLAPRIDRPKIFTASNAFGADPDIVLRASSGECLAIGDVKYKDWPGDSSEGLHGDLYQLLVHAAAFEAGSAFLVYPHDRFSGPFSRQERNRLRDLALRAGHAGH